jgi:hypothetical protein
MLGQSGQGTDFNNQDDQDLTGGYFYNLINQ